MSLVAELKRRNVFKVGAAYLALGWVVVQLTGTIAPAMHLPDWTILFVLWIGAIGFPFVVVFSWVYELTPEGLKRETEIDRSQSITHVTSKRLDYIIIALLVGAIALFVLDRFVSAGAGHARDQIPATDETAAEDTRGHGPLPQAPDAKSIAVLPFADMSQAGDQEYFSDGIAEELLNLLAKVPELRVTSRNSAFSFKGKALDTPEIARKLNVAYVLEGSVRKGGDKIRVTAQLIDARSDTHLWSETWDRTLDDIFAVQDEIAAAVVAQMKIKLLGEAPKSRVTDPQAYALFLRARQLSESGTVEALQQAADLYSQGLAIDPGYAEGWRKLAAIVHLQKGMGVLSPEEGYRQVREYVAKSLAVDPEFARGHEGLGMIALQYELDLPAAARHYTRALSLDPTNLNTINNSMYLMESLGRMQEAIAIGEYITARDPLSALTPADLAYAYIFAGHLDQAIATARTALSLSPGYLSAHNTIAMALLLKGDASAALAEALQEPSEMWRLAILVPVLHALGQHAESDAALATLIDKYEHSVPYAIAAAYAYRSENDRAFEWLDKALAYRDAGLAAVRVDPYFAKLHEDPRWLPFLRAHGMAPEQLAAIQFEVKLPR